MPIAQAAQAQRRSMLHCWHREQGAEFAEFGGWLAVSHYGSAPAERLAANTAGLCDLSAMPRIGVTGSGATDWLRARGYRLPAAPNRAFRQAKGDTLVRLSDQEYLWLGTRMLSDIGSPFPIPDWADLPERRVYVLPRLDSHCCLGVTGNQAPELLSKVCAVDLRPQVFADGTAAQTSLVHTAAIIVRHDLRTQIAYLVLATSLAAQFVFEAILDATAEFNGKPVGLLALQPGDLES